MDDYVRVNVTCATWSLSDAACSKNITSNNSGDYLLYQNFYLNSGYSVNKGQTVSDIQIRMDCYR